MSEIRNTQTSCKCSQEHWDRIFSNGDIKMTTEEQFVREITEEYDPKYRRIGCLLILGMTALIWGGIMWILL